MPSRGRPVPWTELFRALADESRLGIFALLARRPHFGEELAEALGLSPATITHHARTLRQAGLLDSRKEGRYVLHSLRSEGLEDLRSFARELDQLGAQLKLPTEEELSAAILQRHLDSEGRIRVIPTARRPRAVILRWAAGHLDTDRLYPDRELRLEMLRLSPNPEALRDALLQERWLRQSGLAFRRVEEIEER